MKYALILFICTIWLFSCNNNKQIGVNDKPKESHINQPINTDTTETFNIIDTTHLNVIDFEQLNYIFIGSNSYVEFYGASYQDKWYNPQQVMNYLKENDIKINVFGSYEEVYDVPVKSDFVYDEICSCVSFNLIHTDFSSSVIGISGDWDIYDKDTDEGYEYTDIAKKSLSSLLLKEGISEPVLNIEKINRLDFNNDDKEDIIFQAENDSVNKQYLTLKGSYSVIMLISDINGSANEMTILKTIYKQDSESEMDLLVPFELLDICDLNGDNIPEFIISSGYYEGGGNDVYTFRDGAYKRILGCICGT